MSNLQSLRAKRKTSIKTFKEEAKDSLHRIDKKQVNLKAAEGSTKATGDLGSTFTPDAEQLVKINQFTRRTVGADDVVCFPTMSCNDLFDRDDERFTTETIHAFAALEPPMSFTGKSFMADHDYKMEKVRGRIFDTGTAEQDGVNYVTNQIYVPNTPQYQNYIENLDFGLAWAVSVGVVIDKANCTICEAPIYSGWFGSFCAEGHDKGYFYVPGEEEDDGWGGFMPVDPETKGAVKCQVNLSDPIDAYELSQVFLGAQYMAELAKKPSFKGVLKAASAKTIPILGLSRKEADELPIPEEDPKVVEARQQYTVTINDEGEPTWVDDDGLVWVYTVNSETNNNEVMCLGRSAEDGSEAPGQVVRADGQEVAGGEDGSLEVAGGSREAAVSEAGGSGGLPREPLSTNGEEKTVSKKSLVAAMRAAKFPGDLVEQVEAVESDDLTALLAVVNQQYGDLTKQVDKLTTKAELGDAYLKSLRSDALSWYVKARQEDDGRPVSTKTFSKLLDRCADDEEMLKEIVKEQKDLAQAKFPPATRRSTFEGDHNERQALEPVSAASEANGKFAQRIHR